ncbi:terminase [Salinivibrio sp. VYel6]|uniref:phage terminase small subunit n=1 Tax=Salinivibrio sp. VYel6 TaxID=2490493 RepID=UPI00128BC25F|nr:phage terminase small subunit [Salinivibrio sp. VYel6]MPX98202.1 terminase [Salinivibrio sp. VYel6]
MKLSPVQRAKARAQAGQTAPLGQDVDTDSLHIKLIELDEDVHAMRHRFAAIADRIKHKRDVLLPKYQPLAQAFIDSGDRYQNPLFAHVLVWLFDVEDLEQAIEWCLIAIERDIPTPDFMKRNWPTFCADQVFDWCERQAENGESIEPYFSQVFTKIRDDWRLHEKVNAKWFKFAGLILIRDENGRPRPSAVGDKQTLEAAYALLEQAHNYHAKVGVKTMMNKIEMRISALDTGKNL